MKTYRRSGLSLLVAVAAVHASPVRATGQEADSLATLRGQVLSRAQAEPVEQAFVFLTVSGKGAMTNEQGRFTIPDVPGAEDTIQISYLGVDPSKTAVQLQPGHITNVTLLLGRTVIEVADLEVEVRRLMSAKMRGFEERRRKGFGKFVTPQQIEQRQPRNTSDMLRGIAGILVGRDDLGGAEIAFTRGSSGTCVPDLYLDGQPMFQMPVDDIPATDLMAIEIYQGTTQMPPQWAKGSCGLLVVWTKDGPIPEDSP
jgi:hypothetical protein